MRGHLWAYRNELQDAPALDDGSPADLYAAEGRFVGRGFYQASGGIAVRMLTRHQESVDGLFLRERIERARQFRDERCGGEAYRWLHGESDGLPGLVADRYGEVVSAQSMCAFYTPHAEALAEAFLACDGVKSVRLAIAGQRRWFGVEAASVDVDLDGLQISVDVEQGQKTGMYLDQRRNAFDLRRYARGARVLDGHCYEGLWSCSAALAGAKHVLGVDTSAQAIDHARRNVERNGFTGVCTFERGDVAGVLEHADPYDIVILDPPPLAKSRSQKGKALTLYRALNKAAIKAVAPGGYLISSSCSHLVAGADFLEALKRAARSAQRQAWILSVQGAPPDHPVLMAMPETSYLTCVTLRVF